MSAQMTLTLGDDDGDGLIVCSDSVSLAYGAGTTPAEAIRDWVVDFESRCEWQVERGLEQADDEGVRVFTFLHLIPFPRPDSRPDVPATT